MRQIFLYQRGFLLNEMCSSRPALDGVAATQYQVQTHHLLSQFNTNFIFSFNSQDIYVIKPTVYKLDD
jgi:hypothetical protein